MKRLKWILVMALIAVTPSCHMLHSSDPPDTDQDEGGDEDDTRIINLRAAIKDDIQWQDAVVNQIDRYSKASEVVKGVDKKLICVHDGTKLVQYVFEGEKGRPNTGSLPLVRKAYYCKAEHTYWIHDRIKGSSWDRVYGPFKLKR